MLKVIAGSPALPPGWIVRRVKCEELSSLLKEQSKNNLKTHHICLFNVSKGLDVQIHDDFSRAIWEGDAYTRTLYY